MEKEKLMETVTSAPKLQELAKSVAASLIGKAQSMEKQKKGGFKGFVVQTIGIGPFLEHIKDPGFNQMYQKMVKAATEIVDLDLEPKKDWSQVCIM
jgi:hypothetical protein